jgi:hypothetical protein
MKHLRLIIIISSVAISFLIYLHLNNFFKIDKCLDRGGRWDYQQNVCKFE